ncbi:cyclic nucleotide-binding domain-containing protein [Coraliomargarita sp. SDUM461003]|uniref:Cyclic nucleotide-binding domain-containing protein n=1 Tax=Thalassobacterium maritimum TaxID=3041265 RepID=A0ABU1B164_9BACT|nr:cyclic nucleotide-binding domain-containing protein [Coraliomargarita sp. SDUM461003]MDQ8209424.1 cyclic nucleotide-binding domain-containing protein [Coraliomargarita sp. SDUM461003]
MIPPKPQFEALADPESVLPILEKISFLGGITDEKRALIFQHFQVAHFAKGAYIAKEGEEPSHLYIIQEGQVELQITDRSVTVSKRSFHVGDCFGEAAMLSLINNTASFVAAEDCTLIMLSRRNLNKLRGEAPDIFCQLMVNLARDLARKLQYTDMMLLKKQPGTPVEV